MTSDAKIGLLLGLVFIFVIAFVINGLPSLRPPISKVGATTTSPLPDEDFTPGVTRKAELGVAGLLETPDQHRAGDDATKIAGEKAATEESKVVTPEPLPSSSTPPVLANDPTVRKTYDLSELLKNIPTLKKDPTSTIVLDTPRTTPELPVADGRQETTLVPQARSEPTSTSRTGEMLTKVADTHETPKSAAVAKKLENIPAGTVYTTVNGDNLASVAKKVYGPVEGNRYVNVQRIFHANEAALDSADKVKVGMKLIIPPLPKAAAVLSPTATLATNKPSDMLTSGLFERVESMGKRAPAAAATTAVAPAPSPDARSYTVQSGDNLWKIAASQLGNGSRCDEIYKLNVDTIKNRDALDVGTKLRLPAK
jgi:nucleoid-associated protein YgaU